ncbi:hypothetical protein FNU79_00970 [Deinococcus detaillensis]|uniref:Lipoprotein n=1 Tax=Deinococcus detaillensis TaxID=2592048 RepID=A0A553V612_9DEIO|nr:hypothetical protein [Deinococcus detaillensis]TSA87854.1 hypothetical protein FNU79_00970 [Deinococcus detaillensis]
MKSFLRSSPLLLTVSLLCACAPVATKTAGNSVNTADNPLRPGDVYVLTGTDQNGKAFDGKLKITQAKTQYSPARQQYFVDADKGYLVTNSGGIIAEAWLKVGASYVICVPDENETRLPYRGSSLRGTNSEITAIINKYSGTDSSYYGGSRCLISKG